MGLASGDIVGEVVSLLAEQMPEREVRSLVLLGEGADHIAYEVDGELIVRFAKSSDPAAVEREVGLLRLAAEVSPLPVPEPLFTIPDRGCLAYRKLAGVPLIDLPDRPPAVPAALGELLAALHAVPAERAEEVARVDETPPAEWLAEAAASYDAVADALPAGHRPAVQRFLAETPPGEPARRVFSHHDLGIEHVLIDAASGLVTGIIDWSDAAITDPACDFGLVLRDLGPAALDAALTAYTRAGGDPAGVRERAPFYARCDAIEDLAYALETGWRAYGDKTLAALPWLFPAPAA